MNTAPPVLLNEPAILRILQESKAEAAAGRTTESDQLLAQLARKVPNHPAVLNELGVRMMSRGVAERAHALFVRATTADPKHPALWANLASSLKALGRRAEELDAIEKALQLEPRHLSALLQKGAVLEESGDRRNAARVYANALACLPRGAEPPPAVREALKQAKALVQSDQAELGAELEKSLAAVRQRNGSKSQPRVDRCLEILVGASKAFHSEPTWMYFPQLPAVEFFDRSEFPWLDAIEAATDDIRSELLQVLAVDQAGLQPYIDFPLSMPLDQWRSLNRSRRWSAYFLWNQGVANASHIARCPVTARVLQAAPRPQITSRAPTAFFSMLDPQTRIPAHSGVSNTRLTVHLPLLVPESCGFRVGGSTRDWVNGKAWVFDDTIEHEAWNDSDSPRAILIFDIWNPLMTTAECELIQAATEAYVAYYAPQSETST